LFNDKVVGAVSINLYLLELAGRDLVLEKDIEIGVCETLWLGETEECPNETEDVETGPEETREKLVLKYVETKGFFNHLRSFTAPVPRCGIHEARLKDTNDDSSNVVDITGENHGFDTETGGR